MVRVVILGWGHHDLHIHHVDIKRSRICAAFSAANREANSRSRCSTQQLHLHHHHHQLPLQPFFQFLGGNKGSAVISSGQDGRRRRGAITLWLRPVGLTVILQPGSPGIPESTRVTPLSDQDPRQDICSSPASSRFSADIRAEINAQKT